MKPDMIKERIQSLCPDVKKANCNPQIPQDHYCPGCDNTLPNQITLAVVLRAIQKHLGLPNDALPFHTAQLLIHWNLLKDYDDQDEPTKAFIGSLLGV